MAFLFDCEVRNFEFRGRDSGVAKKSGHEYRRVRMEDPEGHSVEVSTSDERLFPTIDGMQKGVEYDCRLRVVATRDRAYCLLLAAVPTAELYVTAV